MGFEWLADPTLEVLLPAVSLTVISFILGMLAQIYVEKKTRSRSENEADRIIEEAKREAENLKKEARLEAQEELEDKKEELEEEYAVERDRLEEKEQQLEEKEERLEEKLEDVYDEINELKDRRERLDEREQNIREKMQEAEEELERISGLTADQAREELRESLIQEAREQTANTIRKIESEAKDEAEQKARRIIARSLQRCAVEQTTESTVQVIDLPSDDMKGRIIGREGRNIRAFEKVTGVDLIVDDTPEAVSISCFDPVRREVAKKTLEKLIKDGRIQPARIEEVHEKTRGELDEQIYEIGEEALSEAGIPGIDDELVLHLGKLNYVIEAGQNQLEHSVQVAHLAGRIAGEMGADVDLAKRAGMLHAIGKTVSHRDGQPYALAGADLAEKHGEPDPVIYAIASHNEDRPFKTVEGIITHVAHLISVNRPGARKEKFENFINRLEKLEELAEQFDGVENSFAIQSGRELRVVVNAEVVEDDQAEFLARDIADQIQQEIDFPEQIKISLLRERRVVDFAR
jgi:ribonuclease Y